MNSKINPTRQELSKLLQLHGYSTCREALVLLDDHYSRYRSNYDDIDDFINKVNNKITYQTDSDSSIIDADLGHTIVSKLTNDTCKEQLDESAQNTIDVKNVQYLQRMDSDRPMSGSHDEFNIHYNFLFKRLSALSVFQGDFKLTKCDSLMVSTAPSTSCICFGLITKDPSKIDGYTLTDNTGRVPLRIRAEVIFRQNIVYSNCILLVEGVYLNPDDILYAAKIGLPPILLDPVLPKSLAFTDDHIIVLLNDVHFDDDDVLHALDTLFAGYDSMTTPPRMFVLIGDFTEKDYPLDDEYKAQLKKFFRLLKDRRNLHNSHFVFVPGDRDSGYKALPKAPLSRSRFPTNLAKMTKIKNVHLATNPVHINYGGRQISIVSQDYINPLRKNLMYDMSDRREEPFEAMRRLMLSNGHFCAGVSKLYTSSLNLWHTPDLLVLADTGASGREHDISLSMAQGASFATVPSFSRHFYQFKVYYPHSGDIEDSQISSIGDDVIDD